MKTWTPGDIRRLIDAALDGFAWEFYSVHTYKNLGREEKIRITRALKEDAKARASYEYMMKGTN
jgi:hypothetical protein